MSFFDDEHITFRLLQMSPTYRESYLESWKQINSLHPARGTALILQHPSLDYDDLSNITTNTTLVREGNWPYLIMLPEQILETTTVFVIEIIESHIKFHAEFSAQVLDWVSPKIMMRAPSSIGLRPVYSFEEMLELEKVGELSSCVLADTTRLYQDDAQVSLWATNVCPYSIRTGGINMFNLPIILFSNKSVAHLYAESLQRAARLTIKNRRRVLEDK